MAGASGFLGTRLATQLRHSGHEVVRLVRRPTDRAGEATWDPAQGRLGAEVLAGADAVINLAGASISGRRWTEAYKRVLRSSRIDTTDTIARTIGRLPEGERPQTLLQASGTGWYGDTGEQETTEEAPAGNTFLADLSRVWEAAARPAEDAGTRVVLLRTAPVIGVDAALLKPLLPLFKLGGGARLGGGRQWMTWMAVPDWLAAAEFLLDRVDLAGPVNMVSPLPVRNDEFTRELARAVRRPALLAVPGPVLDAVLGEMAGELQRSQRLLPGVLSGAGFAFGYPRMADALAIAVRPEAAMAS